MLRHMRKSLVLLCMLAGCDQPLDAEGQRLALAGDGASTALEGSFKAGWVIAPAADASDEAIEAAKVIVNTVFGLCASAGDQPHGLSIWFNGHCGVPFTDLRFEGGLAVSAAEGTLHIGFDRLQLPSLYLSGIVDFTRLPDGSIAWEYGHLSASVGGHDFTLDGGGTARYSGDRVRWDGAGKFASDEVTAAFVASDVERSLVGGCWPDRGTLTVTMTVVDVTRTLVYHYGGDRGVRVDYKGQTVDHDLPDRDCVGTGVLSFL
jgi:hypothetical protein